MRPRVEDPRREELAWSPFPAHTSNMPRPMKLTELDVKIERLEPKPFPKLRVADVMSPYVPTRDTTHHTCTHAVMRLVTPKLPDESNEASRRIKMGFT